MPLRCCPPCVLNHDPPACCQIKKGLNESIKRGEQASEGVRSLREAHAALEERQQLIEAKVRSSECTCSTFRGAADLRQPNCPQPESPTAEPTRSDPTRAGATRAGVQGLARSPQLTP